MPSENEYGKCVRIPFEFYKKKCVLCIWCIWENVQNRSSKILCINNKQKVVGISTYNNLTMIVITYWFIFYKTNIRPI